MVAIAPRTLKPTIVGDAGLSPEVADVMSCAAGRPL
jgi:hypothetical protein